MRRDYPPLDINPVFPGHGVIITVVVVSIIIIMIIIIIIIIIIKTDNILNFFLGNEFFLMKSSFKSLQATKYLLLSMPKICQKA